LLLYISLERTNQCVTSLICISRRVARVCKKTSGEHDFY